jgi:hypothetical protein
VAQLALDDAGLDAYYQRMTTSHDFNIEVDVLTMNERLIGQATFLDGQVNFQRQERDSTNGIARTANLVLSDPGDLLQVSMWQGQAFGNKLVRIRHTVEVPGYGEVVADVGTFVISQPQGDNYELTVELQDKTALAIRGTKPYRIRKGKNAVQAWVDMLRDTTGETKFRVPSGIKRTLPDPLNVGWSDDASPWAVGQKIADLLDMEQLYSNDGYATLRPTPTTPVWTFDTDVNVTDLPKGAYDWADAVNYVRVGGGKNGAKPGIAIAPPTHPNTPGNLARNDVPRYLTFVSDKRYKKYADRNAAASRILARELPMNNDMSWPVIPVFHIDPGDPVRLRTPDGSTTVPLREASIPLQVGGDGSSGATRPVSIGYTKAAARA